MSEIAIYQPQKQSLSEITFLKDTHLQTKIRNADGYELTKSLAHWITETSFALGIKDPISKFNKSDVVGLVLNKYKNLSVDELYYAFKMERYGNLEPNLKNEPWVTPHYQMFNAEYVGKVLDKYRNWKRKMSIEHEISAPIKKKSQTDAEKQYWINRGVLSCLECFEADRMVPFDKIYVYDILYDDGHLSTDVVFKKQMYEDAKLVLQMEYSEKKALNIKEKKEFKAILDNIHIKGNAKVISKAKELVLNKFFRELTANEEKLAKFKEKYKY